MGAQLVRRGMPRGFPSCFYTGMITKPALNALVRASFRFLAHSDTLIPQCFVLELQISWSNLRAQTRAMTTNGLGEFADSIGWLVSPLHHLEANGHKYYRIYQ